LPPQQSVLAEQRPPSGMHIGVVVEVVLVDVEVVLVDVEVLVEVAGVVVVVVVTHGPV
jgi:hypothetical protein